MPTSEAAEAPDVGALPARVRDRVVALTAEVLPGVPSLPGPLARVATFAPTRRARLGGSAIVQALVEESFREAVGTQVAAAGDAVAARGPADEAARAWLVRGEGWSERLAAGLTGLDASGAEEVSGARAEAERLREQVAGLRAELRDLRAAHRAELDDVRAEHQTLRRRLGEARREAREAVAERDAVVAEAAAARLRAEQREEQAEAEIRRARTEVEEARAAAAAERRDTRAGREEASVRARYLLDTLVDAATGLRRELALPPAATTPGAAVERELDEAAEAAEAAQPRRGLTTPALDHLLAMPRARLLVDGYNVSKETWPTATLEAQRSRLVGALGPLVARTGAETTVVFDAASAAAARSPLPAPRGVRVVFSPPGVIADDVLRRLVAEEPVGRVVVAVTSDAALSRDLTAAGARVVPSSALIRQLTR